MTERYEVFRYMNGGIASFKEGVVKPSEDIFRLFLDRYGKDPSECVFVDDMPTMVRFYRDVLGFEIKEGENAVNVYLIKDGTLFMLYERKNFEKMTSRKYEYLKGLNGHFEIALYVDTFEEEELVDIDEVKQNIASIEAELAEVQAQMAKYLKELGL